jgi:hypothetical protein
MPEREAQANTSQQLFGIDDWDKWRLNFLLCESEI